jgi:PAS domain S-box-containing protein
MTYNTFGCFLFDLLTLLLLVVLANQSRRLIAFLPAVILPVCLAIFQVFGLFNDSSAGFHAPSIHAATLFDLRFSAVVFASTIATYAYTTNLRRLLMRSTAADRLITKVLADSVSVCPSGLGPTIGQSLEDVASFVRADYANIMVISQDRAILSCEYEYCLPGVNGWQAELKSLDLRGMPWTAANLNENKVVYLRSMSMLPPEAKAERDLPTFRAGIKSIASLPLTFGGRVNGLLNLASFTRESPWTGETIEHLRAIANTFASSIERQRAAREVIESESKYRIAFDNAPLGMYRNTVDGRVISVNNMMATMFGASSVEEIMELQDDIATQFYANPGERADFVREVLESAGYVCREIVERRLDGTELTVRSKMRAVRDEAGRPLYTEGFIEDITETKRAFESLQRRYEFDKLITSIVAKFASCDAQDIDGSVISALEGLAGALRAEQAYVIMVSPDGVRYSATHEWTSPDVSPLAPYYQNVSMGFAPWTEQTILSDLVVNVSRLSDYPRIADRELKAAPARLGRKSFLGVPIHGRAGSIAGMIAMGTFSREVSWSDRDIAKLRIAGDAVACVLERKISEEATRRQSQYDELISKTLFRFATCRPEHIDESVELALKDICDVFNGERAFLTLFSDDLSTYTCTHEWFRDNYGPAKQNFVNVLIGTLPKMESAILADSPIILAEFDEPGIGPDTLTKFLATIKSRLIVPIHGLAGTIIGMVGLSSYSDKVAWTEKDIAQVRLLGDALANVIERKRADNALKRAAEFDELIAKLLSDFATCASRDLDVTITRAIRTFGSYVGASHAHISMLAQDRTGYTCTHEWCDDGAPSMAIEIQNLPMGSMPWFENIILGDNNVRLRNVGDLPKDVRNERSSPYLRLGYKSLLIVPIRNGEITGSIALASYETTIDWQDGDIRHLKVVGDAIASLIDRNRTEQEVRDLNSSLEQRINRRTADLEEARKKAIEIMHDVDEQRRRAEEALAQLEFTTEHLRLLSQAVDNSPAMVMITDKAYQIEYVNPKFTEVTGYAAAEVLGRDSAFLLYDSDSDGANGELSSALAAGIHWSGEIRSRRKSGELF